jgi:hypothetical protein
MIEDVYLLDARMCLLQHLLYFFVIPISHNLIVYEQLLFRWDVVDSKARVVCSELLLLPADVVDVSFMVQLLERLAGAVNLGPGLSSIRGCINVLED